VFEGNKKYKQIKNKKMITNILIVVGILWLIQIIVAIVLFHIYKKIDKTYGSELTLKDLDEEIGGYFPIVSLLFVPVFGGACLLILTVMGISHCFIWIVKQILKPFGIK
jgi:hypothetical protein